MRFSTVTAITGIIAPAAAAPVTGNTSPSQGIVLSPNDTLPIMHTTLKHNESAKPTIHVTSLDHSVTTLLNPSSTSASTSAVAVVQRRGMDWKIKENARQQLLKTMRKMFCQAMAFLHIKACKGA